MINGESEKGSRGDSEIFLRYNMRGMKPAGIKRFKPRNAKDQ